MSRSNFLQEEGASSLCIDVKIEELLSRRRREAWRAGAAWGELSPGSRPSSRHIPMLDTAAWKISVGQQKYLSHCWWWWWGRVQQLKLGNHNPAVLQCGLWHLQNVGGWRIKEAILSEPTASPLHFWSTDQSHSDVWTLKFFLFVI